MRAPNQSLDEPHCLPTVLWLAENVIVDDDDRIRDEHTGERFVFELCRHTRELLRNDAFEVRRWGLAGEERLHRSAHVHSKWESQGRDELSPPWGGGAQHQWCLHGDRFSSTTHRLAVRDITPPGDRKVRTADGGCYGLPAVELPGPSSQRTLVAVLAAVLVAWTAGSARADCPPLTYASACLDADPLWVTAAPSPFVAVSAPRTTAPRRLVAGLALSHARRPIQLIAPAPDPRGRQLVGVAHLTTTTVLLAYGFARHSEVVVAAPFTLDQRGAGVAVLTTQQSSGVRRRPWRDPRFGYAIQLWEKSGKLAASAAARYTVSLPWGDDDAFSTNRSAVSAPAVVVGFEYGRLVAASEVGLRLRQATRLGTARVGSELAVAVGAATKLVKNGRLLLAAELTARPSLVRQPARPDGGRPLLAPAEWRLTLDQTLRKMRGPTLQLGAGGGLRWSTTGGAPNETVAGVTTPSFRAVLVIRHSFDPDRSARTSH